MACAFSMLALALLSGPHSGALLGHRLGGFAGAMVGSWVSEYQRAYWIEESCLVRGRFGANQRCDLAVAAVAADNATALLGPSLPKLIAAEPGSQPMMLRLRVRERWNWMLPSAELTLLADAISSRTHMDAETKVVVDGLRAMASDPFGARH